MSVTGGVLNDQAVNSLGSGPLAVSGGTVNLNNAQSSMRSALSGGVLNLAAVQAIGSGPLTVSGGTLNANAAQSPSSVAMGGGLVNLADRGPWAASRLRSVAALWTTPAARL